MDQAQNLLAEKVFQAVGPAVFTGGVFGAPFFKRVFQFAQEFALVFTEFDRRFHGDVAIQIPRVAGTHAFNAHAAQPELFARLRAFWNINSGFTG